MEICTFHNLSMALSLTYDVAFTDATADKSSSFGSSMPKGFRWESR